MRPTVNEQLVQARRILLERVLPAVDSDHVADIVRRLAADLRKLETVWDREAGFDAWEAQTLIELLGQLAPDAPAPGRSPEVLRSALATAIGELPDPQDAPELWAAVHEYFTGRLDRDPMTNRMTGASS